MTQTEVGTRKHDWPTSPGWKASGSAGVYVEQIETWPAAFDALVAGAIQDSVTGVLLPSMPHFSVLGPPPMIKRHFERLTKTRAFAVPEMVSYKAAAATTGSTPDPGAVSRRRAT